MAAIASGMTAYFPQSATGTSGLIPVVSTFFMFTLCSSSFPNRFQETQDH